MKLTNGNETMALSMLDASHKRPVFHCAAIKAVAKENEIDLETLQNFIGTLAEIGIRNLTAGDLLERFRAAKNIRFERGNMMWDGMETRAVSGCV